MPCDVYWTLVQPLRFEVEELAIHGGSILSIRLDRGYPARRFDRADSHGVEARGIGLLDIKSQDNNHDYWKRGRRDFALHGGRVTANGAAITTLGTFPLAGFNADGAALAVSESDPTSPF
jgi:hypothetical protein